MIREELFNDGQRKWVFFGRDPQRVDTLIDTNEYLVVDGQAGLLPDPGGIEIFPEVVTAISGDIQVSRIETIFATHQDPDVISSLFLWLGICPNVRVIAPSTWTLFIPHFGSGRAVEAIPDAGGPLHLGSSSDLRLIPAHYVHSSGNFSLWDPKARILFSGDIGAALLPPEESGVFVKDFDRHRDYMTGFHRRWMPSNRAKNSWVERVRELPIEMICPQHGSIFRGADAARFLEWFGDLEVGSAVE